MELECLSITAPFSALEYAQIPSAAGMLHNAGNPFVGDVAAANHRELPELRTKHVTLKQSRQSIAIRFGARFPRREMHADHSTVDRELCEMRQKAIVAGGGGTDKVILHYYLCCYIQ